MSRKSRRVPKATRELRSVAYKINATLKRNEKSTFRLSVKTDKETGKPFIETYTHMMGEKKIIRSINPDFTEDYMKMVKYVQRNRSKLEQRAGSLSTDEYYDMLRKPLMNTAPNLSARASLISPKERAMASYEVAKADFIVHEELMEQGVRLSGDEMAKQLSTIFNQRTSGLLEEGNLSIGKIDKNGDFVDLEGNEKRKSIKIYKDGEDVTDDYKHLLISKTQWNRMTLAERRRFLDENKLGIKKDNTVYSYEGS